MELGDGEGLVCEVEETQVGDPRTPLGDTGLAHEEASENHESHHGGAAQGRCGHVGPRDGTDEHAEARRRYVAEGEGPGKRENGPSAARVQANQGVGDGSEKDWGEEPAGKEAHQMVAREYVIGVFCST